MQLYFSAEARTDLLNILDRYEHNRKRGRQARATLINAATHLKSNPRLGRVFEELSELRNIEYRFIISGGYKIIYHILEDQQLIAIDRFFDTRQSPDRLLR